MRKITILLTTVLTLSSTAVLAKTQQSTPPNQPINMSEVELKHGGRRTPPEQTLTITSGTLKHGGRRTPPQ